MNSQNLPAAVAATLAASALLVVAGIEAGAQNAPATLNEPDMGVLIRYDSVDAFQGAARSRNLVLRHEDFENSMARFLNQMEFAACTEPVSSRSDDACFAPGDLVEGFAIRSSHRRGVLSQGVDILQVDSMTIGAWPYQVSPSSLNYTRVEFDDPPTLVAADVYGFQLASGSATGDPVPVQVEAFDQEGQSLGSFIVQPSTYNVPAFAGFQSPVPIAAVEFGTRVQIAGEQIDNLYFGGGAGRPVPDREQVDFGVVTPAQVGIEIVQVGNGGSLPLSLDAPQLTGSGAFEIEDENCSQTPIAAGGSCLIWLSFQPGYRDDFRAALRLDGDNPGAPLRLRLRGVGAEPAGGGQ